ncbi:MAG: type IV pilus assembly protein PilM [Phycisphaerales bacterium]|nr:type IV pilus assembly protein PilM [Phycisphaerales bacterium]
MASSNVCWGIEMGYGAIKALKVENDGGTLKVVDFAVINHPRVLSTPELDQNDAMRVALGTLVSKHDLTNARVAISIPGHASFARFATLPPVEPKKVPDIVKFEAVQQIPFPLEEVEWDYQTFVSPDSPDIEVGIFAVTRQKIAEQLAMLNDVGLTPELATLSPVAAYNSLAVDLGFTEETPGTIILDIGTVATDMIIAEAGRVWVRSFPIGGHQFTEALVSAFKLSYSKAEKLKRESDQSKHARHVFQAMRPVFSDIVGEIQRSIGFYQSVHADADLKRLIGLGSTFRLPGLRKYLKQQLQLDVYRMEQFKKLNMEGPRAGEFQAASVNMATAYGCVNQVFDRAPLRANLMPVAVLKEAMWKRKVPYFAVGAGLAAAAAGAMFIRPLIDSTAFQGAERPPVIRNVINDANSLATAARDAQVTTDASGSMQAAGIVDLVDNRALYASILSDTSNLISMVDESAQALIDSDSPIGRQLGDADPFKLISLETEFLDSPAAENNNQFGGGRGGFNDTNSNQPSQFQQSIGNLRRVKVTAQFDVPLPTSTLGGFRDDIVMPILDNKLPPLQPNYAIQYDPASFWVADESAGGRTNTTRGGGAKAPVRDPRTQTTSRGGGTDSSDLKGLAPFNFPEQETPAQTARVTMTWYAVLDLNAASEGDE